MISKIVVSSLIIVLFFFSCTKNNKELSFQNSSDEKSDSVNKRLSSESFDDFYNRFHEDSLFQMSRITFPLEGYNSDESSHDESDTSTYYWKKENWKAHVKVDLSNNGLKQNITRTDTLVTDEIYLPNSGLKIIRNFKLIEGKWYLVYYLDQNL